MIRCIKKHKHALQQQSSSRKLQKLQKRLLIAAKVHENLLQRDQHVLECTHPDQRDAFAANYHPLAPAVCGSKRQAKNSASPIDTYPHPRSTKFAVQLHAVKFHFTLSTVPPVTIEVNVKRQTVNDELQLVKAIDEHHRKYVPKIISSPCKNLQLIF